MKTSLQTLYRNECQNNKVQKMRSLRIAWNDQAICERLEEDGKRIPIQVGVYLFHPDVTGALKGSPLVFQSTQLL